MSDTELNRTGPSYTFDTLADFAARGLTPVDEIALVPSDPAWPRRFEEEAARLRAIIPEIGRAHV